MWNTRTEGEHGPFAPDRPWWTSGWPMSHVHGDINHHLSDDDTWEPISNLECPDNIKEYERVKKEKKREKADMQVKDEPKAKVSQESKDHKPLGLLMHI